MPRVHAAAGYGIGEVLHITRSCVHTGKHSFVTTSREPMPFLPGLLDSMPGAVATAQANNSESSTTERRARAATRWVHGRDRQHRPQPGDEVSDQLGLVSEVGVSCDAGANAPCSRLLLVSWPGEASRPLVSSGAPELFLTVSPVCGRRNERSGSLLHL